MTEERQPDPDESEAGSVAPPPLVASAVPPGASRGADVPLPPGVAVLAAERLAAGSTMEVRADDPWPEAGRKILRFQLARMLARVPGVLSGEDPEEVHAMRVAARRMGAAWRVFGDGFERDARRRYGRELRELGGRLGAVRATWPQGRIDVAADCRLQLPAQHGPGDRPTLTH